MTARLREHALTRVDQHDGQQCGGCAGSHVACVLLVAGGVGDDELTAGGREVAISDVDGDTLLALRAEAVGEERKVELAGGAVDARVLYRGQLVFVDTLGVVKEPPDQSGLPVVYAAGGREPKQFGRFMIGEKLIDRGG